MHIPPIVSITPLLNRDLSLWFTGVFLQGSLSSSPFASDLWNSQEDVRESVDRLLKYNNDERLADLAKEKGKDLYSNLPLDDRSDKIHNMVSPYIDLHNRL